MCVVQCPSGPSALPAVSGRTSMAITAFLKGEHFDAETKRIIGVAFELARIALGASSEADPVSSRVAIELVKGGERNPDRLCEQALSSLGIEQLNGPRNGPRNG